MNALQIYFFVVVLAATVFAIRYTRFQAGDDIVIPSLGTPRSYRSKESEYTGGIPPWKGHVKRSKTRYGVQRSLGHDWTRPFLQKHKRPATPGAEQSAESHSKKRMDFTRTSHRHAKSGGKECERPSLRRGSPMARDVSNDEQKSAESQLEKRNLPYSPPLNALQRFYDYVKKSSKFEARAPTAKKIRTSALDNEGSAAGPSYYDSLIEAALVVTAFHSFEPNGKFHDSSEQKEEFASYSEQEEEIDSYSEQEEELDSYSEQEEELDSYSEQEEELYSYSEQEEDGHGSSEQEEDGDGSSDQEEDGGGSSDQEEEGESSFEQEEESRDSFEPEDDVGEYFKHEEDSKDFFEHEEGNDFFDHEENRNDNEYLVPKNPTPTREFDLDWPVVKECRERMKYVYSIGGLGFYINSWELPENEYRHPGSGEKLSKTFTWVEARNQCRKRCMDLISFESPWELGFYSATLIASNLPFVWTSGRICDYKGCSHRPELKPLIQNGWIWTATGHRLPPTNAKPPKWLFQPWSPTGISNDPQPDNAEFAINGKNESCLALMNNVYGDRVAYHDVACYHKKYFTCEDSPALMDLVERKHGIKLTRAVLVENNSL